MRTPRVHLDRAHACELAFALAGARSLGTPPELDIAIASALARYWELDPDSYCALVLARDLEEGLAHDDPLVRAQARSVAYRRARDMDLCGKVARALVSGVYNDRRRARDLTLELADACDVILQQPEPGARSGGTLTSAGALRARTRALREARDLTLAFWRNLDRPWEQRPHARLLAVLALVLPAERREEFVEEQYSNLMDASPRERWVYLLDLLAALPRLARSFRIHHDGRRPKSPPCPWRGLARRGSTTLRRLAEHCWTS